MSAFLELLALARSLPAPRNLRVLRAVGEELAHAMPFDLTLSFALDAVARLQEEDL